MKRLNQKGVANVIIAVVIVAVLVIGAGYYVLQKNSDDPAQNSTTPATVDVSSGKIEPPYTITATIVDTKDKTKDSKVKIEYQSDKKWRLVTKTTEGTVEVIYTGDYQYLNNGGKWTRIPYSAGNTNNSTSIDAYNVNNDQLAQYKNNSTQLADASCGSATCEVFEVLNPSGAYDKATLYINKDNGNFTKLVYEKSSQTTTIEYDFDNDVNVVPPTNYTDISIPS